MGRTGNARKCQIQIKKKIFFYLCQAVRGVHGNFRDENLNSKQSWMKVRCGAALQIALAVPLALTPRRTASNPASRKVKA